MVGYEQAIDTLMKELMRFGNLVTGGPARSVQVRGHGHRLEMGISMGDSWSPDGPSRTPSAAVPYEDRTFA